MFGFQRVGDMIWACGDMMCRGFLLGGTAGRTTLSGEGLQHQDGHSHVLASTVPNLKSYDPAFAYELAVIVRDGIYRMYECGENIFYYLTLYNENHVMPAMPSSCRDNIQEGILKGAYCYRRCGDESREKVQLLASGAIMQQAILAAEKLEQLGYCATIWSVTSFTELARDAEACERWNRLHAVESPQTPYIQALLQDEGGVYIAVSDYMKSLANSIAKWVPGRFEVLGTDGFGLSESRPDIRDHFEVSADYIVQASLTALLQEQKISRQQFEEQVAGLAICVDKISPMGR
jgi:pyruvate dehydrogenase E1 component